MKDIEARVLRLFSCMMEPVRMKRYTGVDIAGGSGREGVLGDWDGSTIDDAYVSNKCVIEAILISPGMAGYIGFKKSRLNVEDRLYRAPDGRLIPVVESAMIPDHVIYAIPDDDTGCGFMVQDLGYY